MNKSMIWPVGLIAFFALFISATVGLVLFTTHHREELVSANYYEQELGYQQRIDAVRTVREQGLTPRITYEASSQQLILEFPRAPARASAELYRPSDAGLDRPLPLNDAARQVLQVANLASGLWRVRLQWETGTLPCFAEKDLIIP